MTSALAWIDVMLDGEHIERGPDPGWARWNQHFSDWLDAAPRDSRQKRTSIDHFLLADLQEEISNAAIECQISPEMLATWTREQALSDLESIPSLVVFRDVLQAKHLNKGTTWSSNDLTDMVFLSCAVAYADFVVCERSLGGVLRSRQTRLGHSRSIFTNLSDAVDAIDAVLAH